MKTALVCITAQAGGHRSAAAKTEFKQVHPCSSTGNAKGSCPGYVIEHIELLCAGGADKPSNMQWQTVAEGKAKDLQEGEHCRALKKAGR